ncbi:DUF3090 family protein [Nocardioides sp. HDW12B]|uniref:DUF3090 domain-containing protein n=1 Tax=Nocardioides sp. HDW12B TaxID=2714939 RepID=UPI0014092FAF|nr:DUF3090 domain-containing protein [Nocardioides sp. HDW12B]QIK66421.1 DUF3090 family protein [Nocardioides sp. HDW12B]
MPIVHRYDPPERFVAGTVGAPGQRTFFLQARSGVRITSVALEKQQVLVLAERLESLLDDLMQAQGEVLIPAVTPAGSQDSEPLEQPIDEEFRAGTMTLAWDDDAGRVIIEVFPVEDSIEVTEVDPAEGDAPGVSEVVELEVEEIEPDELLVVSLPPALARAFCERAQAVVAAGRPPCQFCGNPLDPAGHLCPRANGFRRR